MPTPLAPDDIVATAEATKPGRAPLVVVDSLVEFLDANGLHGTHPRFTPLGDGHSNVTLLVDRGERNLVLRRPPRGPIPASAHDVLREAKILKALSSRCRVPPVLATCADPDVIGAPFYVMAPVEGHVIQDSLPRDLDEPDGRRRIGFELVDALVEIHDVAWRQVGLGDLGRPNGYLGRQLRRFKALWDTNRTRELPIVDAAAEWLAAKLPESPAACLVHGDYRLGNVLFAPAAPARLNAVLDWELATIGDPLADVGYLSMIWAEPDDPDRGPFEVSAVTRSGGFPSRSELIERYEEGSGIQVTRIDWYEALALWKAIVFMEGNYGRMLRGATDDPFLKDFSTGIPIMAERLAAMTGIAA